MSLFDHIMPTHTQLIRHAVSLGINESAPTFAGNESSGVDPSEHLPPLLPMADCRVRKTSPFVSDPIRKYVIVADDRGREHPIVFSNSIPHSTVIPEGFHPVAAGFVVRFEGSLCIPDLGSDSLHLDPRPQDKQLLAAFLG